MKAAVRYHYGSVDNVQVVDVDKPAPRDGDVLVRVHAASVNRADLDAIHPRPQFVRLFLGLRRPRRPWLGLDVAGVVEAVGRNVTRFEPGDRVFGDMFAFAVGGFAEYVRAPERAFQLMPDGVSFAEAATLPHSALLAIQGFRLRDGRTPLPGDKVLVGGASGNVGPFAVQVAKALGTDVTAVASTPKLDFVRSLGADRVIDYTITDYTSTGDRYDWILDTDTHYSAVRVRRALKPGGVYVSLGGGDTRIIDVLVVAPVVGRATGKHMGLMLWWKPFAERDVLELKRLIASGAVRPAIDRHYSLAEVRDALRYVDDGKPKGKVVIDVAG